MSDRDRYPFAALLAVEALLVCLVALFCAPDASAQEPWTPTDVEMAVSQAPWVVQCITWYESTNQPYAVGAAGEQGPIQLLPSWLGGGEWDFYFHGSWTDLQTPWRSANDPYLTTAFLEHWGATHNWTFWPWSAWRVWCR